MEREKEEENHDLDGFKGIFIGTFWAAVVWVIFLLILRFFKVIS